MKTKRVILFISLLWLCFNSEAQVSRLYTSQNGLKSSSLYTTRFDSKGMAWVTGVATLQLFDGTSFIDVVKDNKELSRAFFLNVMEYKNDTYWLVTSRGLWLYDMRTNQLQHVEISGDEDQMGVPLNRMVKYPKEDYALITTSGFGFFVFDMATRKVDKRLTNRISTFIQDRLFREVFIDENGLLWASAFTNNLICFDLTRMRPVEINMTEEARTILQHSIINQFCQVGKSRNILLATNSDALIYDKQQNLLRALKGEKTPQLNISTIFERNDGTILLGTDSNGLWQIDDDENLIPYPIVDNNIDLSYAKIRTIDEDREGNMIVGIYQKGVLIIPNSQDNFIYHAISPTSRRFNLACITSIAADSKGTYWLCADGCGVMKCSSSRLDDVTQVKEGLASPLVQAITVDRDDRVWVGSFGGGVQYFDGQRFVTPEWLQSLSHSFVMTMAYNSDQNLLFVGTNGAGVYMLDLTHQQITNLLSYGGFNAWTISLYCNQDGEVWCGTVGEVFHFNPKTTQIHRVDYLPQGQGAFAHCFAANGKEMLIGTDTGLYAHDPVSGQSRLILADKNIMSIETTELDLWVATSNEIIRLDKKNMNPHIYTSFGGHYIGEFHKEASYKSTSKEIFYGTDNGVISFSSQHIKRQKPLGNNLIMTSLKVNGREQHYNPKAKDNVMDANLLYANTIEVPYHQNTLSFTFNVPNYSAPNRIFYRYMLEGYDKNWHAVTMGHEAYYSSLPPGLYELVLQAYYESDETNVLEKHVTVRICSPWYDSWWAWLLYMLLIGLALYYVFITYRERQRQKQLLAQAKQNEQIKEAKLRMFTSITHEMKSPLTMIISPLRQLMTDRDENSEKTKKPALTEDKRQSLYRIMKLNSDRLLNVVKQVTDIRKIDSGAFSMHFSEVDICDYADNIFKSFTGYAVSKHISFVIEHGNLHVQLWIDKDHFEKILANLLSNAFKFTPLEGRVRIRTRCILKDSKEWFEFRIYNSGSSISSKDIPHIFERFYQADNGENNAIGSGIGLNLVNELVGLHHGTIDVKNVDPDGVEFVIQFPLGREHLNPDELVSEVSEETHEIPETDNSIRADLLDTTTEDGEAKGSRTVLVVDDDENLCQYIKEILQPTYQVIVAYNGNQAWQQMLTQRPDALLTDIQMPECDGIELSRRVRSNPDTDNIPIIILTSESSDKTMIYSLSLDVDHFINKPFNPVMLQSAIAHSIRVREKMMSKLRRTEVGFDYNATKIDSPDSKLFSKIIQTIKEHIDDSSFDVNALASEVGISRVHLNRKMKERYGTSPNNFIRSYRLKQSAYLLVNNKVSIADVAYRMGFSSHPYFSNVFRDYFGMSPKEFIAYYADNANDEALQKLLE